MPSFDSAAQLTPLNCADGIPGVSSAALPLAPNIRLIVPADMSTTATRWLRDPSATNASPDLASNENFEAPPNISIDALLAGSGGTTAPRPRPRPPPPRAAPETPAYAVSAAAGAAVTIGGAGAPMARTNLPV